MRDNKMGFDEPDTYYGNLLVMKRLVSCPVISIMTGNDEESFAQDEVDFGRAHDCVKETEENHFNVRRNFVSGLMDMALLLANVSQLRTLLSSNVTDAYYYVKCDLVGFSIFLQMVVAVLLLINWNIEYSHKDDKGNQTYVTGFASVKGSMIIQSTQNLNSQFTPRSKCSRNTRRDDTFVIGLIMLIIVINVFITGLGIEGKDC